MNYKTCKDMKKAPFIILFFALFIFSAHSKLYLFIGETGAGKSASINWLAQREIATEGGSYSSQTSEATTYAIEMNGIINHFIDVPGILDTEGLTEEEILQLIKTEIFNQKENHGFDHISGIIILLDGTLTRIRVRDGILAAIKMFGESCLNSIILAINKVEKVPLENRQELFDYVASEANSVGIASNRVVAIDAKTDLGLYYPALEERLRDLPAYYLAGMNELEERAEAYFNEELNKGENYEDYFEDVPRIVEYEVQDQIMIDEAYSTRHCRDVCRRRLLGICISDKEVCDTIYHTRQVPRMVPRTVQETVYDRVHHRKLRNEHDHYRRVGKDRVVQEIRNWIFQQKEQRRNNNERIDL